MDSLNILFTGENQVELRREPVEPLAEGEILVQSCRTMISSGTECRVLTRSFAPGTHWDQWVKYPFYPGYLGAGIVRDLGPGATGFSVGDRVAIRGRHRQFCAVKASAALPIPENVSDEEAAWSGLSKIVQNGVRRAQHELGDAVVVIGLGVLGQLVVQFVRLMGAREIIGIDLSPERLAMASAHGATQVIQATAADAADKVREATEGRGADVVYDVTGFPSVFAPALGMVRRFGTLLLLGDVGDPSDLHLTPDVITRGVRIVGAHDNNPPEQATDYLYWNNANITRLFLSYLSRGQMKVSDLVTHRYAPGEARVAYDMLLKDRSKAMGVQFDWNGLNG